jgi:hypothetical protein
MQNSIFRFFEKTCVLCSVAGIAFLTALSLIWMTIYFF